MPVILTRQNLRRRAGFPVMAFALLLVLFVAPSCMKRGSDSAGAVTSEEERKALGEAVMMLGLAGEDVIRSSAVEVELSALAADPQAWQGKWVFFDSEVVWIQDRDGNAMSSAASDPEQNYVYWLRGPVALKLSGDATAALSPGSSCRAYGRVISSRVSAMGLSDSGRQALGAMDGGSADSVAFFMAKWVE